MRPGTLKKSAIVVHDLLATASALVLSLLVRFNWGFLIEHGRSLLVLVPAFCLVATLVYWFFSLYESKWRFASLPDLVNILRSVAVLALLLIVADYVLVSNAMLGEYFFGKLQIFTYACFQLIFLGGPRLAYRYMKYAEARRTMVSSTRVPVLVLANGREADIMIRAVEGQMIGNVELHGILSPRAGDLGQSVRGIRVLGDLDDLERVVGEFEERGVKIRRLVLMPSAFTADHGLDSVFGAARRLGIPVSRMQGLETEVDSGSTLAQLTPIDIEDLLLRPLINVEPPTIEHLVRGRRVVVTGGGGSIGSEITRRVAALGAERVFVVENAEPALHQIVESMELAGTGAPVEGRICDVRDRQRVIRLFAEIKPHLVFHAAALKHVPYLERDVYEGVRTNVFGSVNVADAAIACEAEAVVLISTDKAIRPVSVLGVTKRLAEIYCQARDATRTTRTRLISVRFGNVLGSVGSVVPRFKAQIERGGPITITHPDMVRYFMTIREAVDLVLTAGTRALGGQAEASVYVLNMGQPVRIMDLAKRMIRLAGYEPDIDIRIEVVGPRPGERLNEELFLANEPVTDIGVPGIVAARTPAISIAEVQRVLAELDRACEREDVEDVKRVMATLVPEYGNGAYVAGPRVVDFASRSDTRALRSPPA